MIDRHYQNLGAFLAPGKTLVIYGSRQVGKTTLLRRFLSQTAYKYKLDTGDDLRMQELLGSQDPVRIGEYVAGYELIAIDEAQRIKNVGIGLKIIADHFPNVRVIATGSSSFELAGQIGEPLTGRKKTLTLYPIAQLELASAFNAHELKARLHEWLIFGSYPAVVTAENRRQKIDVLSELVHSYLLKDILELERVKAAKKLLDLLRLIAFQAGSEVSLAELGSQLSLEAKTVSRYLDLLEKAFVLFNLRGYSKNLRKEITKKSKYYFYDNGIRNAVIANFNEVPLRNDIGRLWENFMVSERLKALAYRDIPANTYFWRTWDQKEIDWIEEREGKLFAYEFSLSPKKAKVPEEFLATYPESVADSIHQENYLPFAGVL